MYKDQSQGYEIIRKAEDKSVITSNIVSEIDDNDQKLREEYIKNQSLEIIESELQKNSDDNLKNEETELFKHNNLYGSYNEESQQKEFTDAVIKNNYKKQALILISIGDQRLEEAINLDYNVSPHLKYHYFSKSSSIYNAALIRMKKHTKSLVGWQEQSLCFIAEVAIKLRISLAEQEFLKGITKSMVAGFSYLEINEIHKINLKEIRRKAEENIESLDDYNPYNIMLKLDKETYKQHALILRKKIKQKELLRAEQIKKIYLDITNKMKELIKSLLEECIRILGLPTCSYAILSLGSLARGEMTPYSDLEWAILIDDVVEKKRFEIQSRRIEKSEGEEREKYANTIDQEIQDTIAENELNKHYFRKLSGLLHLKIINLEETALGTIGEIWLEDLYKDRFNDYDELACGFCFDGQFERACRTPLGNIHTNKIQGKFELIGTACELGKFQSRDWQQNDKLLVIELANANLIAGSKELFQDYKEKISFQDMIAIRKEISFALLKADLDKFKLKIEGNNEGKLYEIKKEIYRLLDRILENLAFYDNYVGLGAWDKIEKMCPFVFNSNAANNLKVALGISTELRLRTYLYYNRRFEEATIFLLDNLEIENTEDLDKLNKFYIPDNGISFNIQILFRFYYTILPLQQELENLLYCNKMELEHFRVSSLNSRDFYVYDYEIKGLIYNRLAKYQEAISNLEKALAEPNNKNNTRIIKILGGIYTVSGEFDKAIKYYKKSLKIEKRLDGLEEHPYIAYSYSSLADIYSEKNQFNKAIKYYKKSLKILQANLTDNQKAIANVWNNMGITYTHMGQFYGAEKYYEKSLEIRNSNKDLTDIADSHHNLGMVYDNLEEFDKAIKYYEKSLEINRHYYKSNIHPAISLTLSAIGTMYDDFGELQLSLNNHKEALRINQVYYRTDSHPTIAACLCNIGLSHKSNGEYGLALDYIKRSLDMGERIYRNKNHHCVATALNNLGEVYLINKDFVNAEIYLERSLKMNQDMYKKLSDHYLIANSLFALGALYHKKRNFDLAFKKYEQSLEMSRHINHKQNTAKSLMHLGIVYIDLGNDNNEKENFNVAIAQFKESLAIMESIYRNPERPQDVIHPEIAKLLDNFALAYRAKKEFTEAIRNMELALSMRRKIYNDDFHPNIVASYVNLAAAYNDNMQFIQGISHSIKAFKVFKKFKDHPDKETIVHSLSKSIESFANYYNFDKNFVFNSVGKSTAPNKDFIDYKFHLSLMGDAYQDNKLEEAAEELRLFQIFCPLAEQEDLLFIGSMYNVLSIKSKEINDSTLKNKFYQKAKELYEQSIKESQGNTKISLYVAYGNFFIQHEKYDEAFKYIILAIEKQNDNSILEYFEIEKMTVAKIIRDEIVSSGRGISLFAQEYAYYLLLKYFEDFGNLTRGLTSSEKYLDEFKNLIEKTESSIGYSLLGDIYRKLGHKEKIESYESNNADSHLKRTEKYIFKMKMHPIQKELQDLIPKEINIAGTNHDNANGSGSFPSGHSASKDQENLPSLSRKEGSLISTQQQAVNLKNIINVLGDGNCLYYSLIMGYLYPHKNNLNDFNRMSINLFGEGDYRELMEKMKNRDIKNEFWYKDNLEALVNDKLRLHLAEHLNTLGNEHINAILTAHDKSATKESLINDIRTSFNWASQAMILIFSHLVKLPIIYHQSGGASLITVDGGQQILEKDDPNFNDKDVISLYFVDNNHFRVFLKVDDNDEISHFSPKIKGLGLIKEDVKQNDNLLKLLKKGFNDLPNKKTFDDYTVNYSDGKDKATKYQDSNTLMEELSKSGEYEFRIQFSNGKTSCYNAKIIEGVNLKHIFNICEKEGTYSFIEYLDNESTDIIINAIFDIKYDNPLLNQQKLINQALKIGGITAFENLIEMGKDPELAEIIIEFAKEYGAKHVVNILLDSSTANHDKFINLIPTIHNDMAQSLLHITASENIGQKYDQQVVNTPSKLLTCYTDNLYTLWTRMVNFLPYKFEINNLVKQYYFSKEIADFKDLLARNNIEGTPIGVLNDKSAFKKQVLLKLHPDKGGNEADFILAKDLQEKLTSDLNIDQIITDNLKTVQDSIYKASKVFKIIDTAVDTIRFVYEPTIHNAKSVVVDSAHLYGMYKGFNGISATITAFDASYKIYQGEYIAAGQQISTAVAFMALPVLIGNTLKFEGKYTNPLIGVVYGAAIATYSAYHTVGNAYSLYQEIINSDGLKALTAYKDVAGVLENSYLQNVYDFKSTKTNYEIKINNIYLELEKSQTRAKLETEQGEFGTKLYEYVYKGYLEEKYDLLSKVASGVITAEQAEEQKANHISLTVGDKSYEHCMQIIKDHDNADNKDHYYCYNKSVQILDHFIISDDDIQLVGNL